MPADLRSQALRLIAHPRAVFSAIGRLLLVATATLLLVMPWTEYFCHFDKFLRGGPDVELSLMAFLAFLCLVSSSSNSAGRACRWPWRCAAGWPRSSAPSTRRAFPAPFAASSRRYMPYLCPALCSASTPFLSRSDPFSPGEPNASGLSRRSGPPVPPTRPPPRRRSRRRL